MSGFQFPYLQRKKVCTRWYQAIIWWFLWHLDSFWNSVKLVAVSIAFVFLVIWWIFLNRNVCRLAFLNSPFVCLSMVNFPGHSSSLLLVFDFRDHSIVCFTQNVEYEIRHQNVSIDKVNRGINCDTRNRMYRIYIDPCSMNSWANVQFYCDRKYSIMDTFHIDLSCGHSISFIRMHLQHNW